VFEAAARARLAAEEAAAEARKRRSALPADVVRLPGGMVSLGSFIGNDAFVRRHALSKVECMGDAASVQRVAGTITQLAASDVRNGRDIAGTLLRCCVVPKVSYLCRTVRPDLLLPAARRADDLLGTAFSSIYSINRGIFTASASAADRLAAARVRLPISLGGCGIRSAIATSEAAYVACMRAVAPSIVAASSNAARLALLGLGATNDPPALRVVAALATRIGALLPEADRQLVTLECFTDEAKGGIQRKLTRAVETAAHQAALEAARVGDDQVMRAFLSSCDGRWIRTARLPHLQLTNEEVLVRMQRYLRQPLSALAGLVGSRGLDAYGARDGRAAHPGTAIDAHGDCFLSAYKAKDDAEWIHLHNALCRALHTFAAQASVSAKLEGGKVRGTKKRPGDVRFAGDAGAHGWTAAHSRELWVDVTVVGPLCDSYLTAAAAKRGAAAADAAARKHTKYRNDIPGLAHFVPLAFESKGFVSADVEPGNKAWITTSSEMGLAPHGAAGAAAAAAAGTAALAMHGCSSGGGRDEAASTSTVDARRYEGF
jgi:hypothetical protein